jgi:zinc protease
MPQPYLATLPNGMELIVFERHTLRVVAAELVVRGGTAGLSHESLAAVRVMLNSLMSGTQRRGEVQLYQTMNQGLIQLYPHSNDTWLGISLRAPSASFDQALSILRDVALEPLFPGNAVEVVRRRMLGNDTAHVEPPSRIAQRNLFAALYGVRHPYTQALASPAQDLANVSRDQAVAAWREVMDPAETSLIVVGDVDPLVVRQSVATLFGDWAHPSEARARSTVPAPTLAAGSGRIIAVDRPGARTTTIVYGGPYPDDSTPRRAAGALLEELVAQAESRATSSAAGGEAGATWRAWRHFPGSTFWWEKTVAPDQVRSVLQELEGWIGELRDREPTANDLQIARARATHGLPLAFETVENIADTYGDIVGAERPLDSIAQFVAAATELRWPQIRDALPQPDQMRAVVVGDLAAVMDQLFSLGWGPVEVHDPDGRLLRTVSR